MPATIVGARSGLQADDLRGAAASSMSASRASSSSTVPSCELVAVHARGVVGVELLVDGGRGGGGAGDGDAAVDRCALLGGKPVVQRAARVLRERLQLLGTRRVGVDVALAHAHDAGVQRDVEAGAAPDADDELGRAAADVDHDGRPSSSGSAAGRPDMAPRNVSCASSSPLSTRASSRNPRARAAANCAPLAASRTAEVSTARLASQPCSSIAAR